MVGNTKLLPRFTAYVNPGTFRCCNLALSPAAGDDSSNEDQGEEREGEEMEKKNKKVVESDDGGSGELSAVPEDNVEVEEGSEEEEQMKNEDSKEFSFPDTTISLSHLQPSR